MFPHSTCMLWNSSTKKNVNNQTSKELESETNSSNNNNQTVNGWEVRHPKNNTNSNSLIIEVKNHPLSNLMISQSWRVPVNDEIEVDHCDGIQQVSDIIFFTFFIFFYSFHRM